MKKMIHSILLISLLLLFSSPSAFANDPYYDAGYNIGQGIGNLGSGDQKIDEYINPNYDFSKIKKIALVSFIPNENIRYVTNKNLPLICIDELKKIFKEANLIVDDLDSIYESPIFRKDLQGINPPDEETIIGLVSIYIAREYDAILFIRPLGYMYSNDGSAVSYLSFLLRDSKTLEDIFFREELRVATSVGVFRQANPLGVTKRIIGKYTKDLIDKINKK